MRDRTQITCLEVATKSHAFERYIRRGDEPDSEPVNQRKRILLAISLFKKISYGRCFQNEVDALLKLVQKLDAGIHLAHFAETMETLKSQKMLRGEDTLYLAHDMLRIWLWVRFWETYGQYFNIDDMLKNMPSSLVGWFIDMFEYVSHSDAAKLAVKQLFDCSGPWHISDTLKTKEGSRLFHALSRADPQFALLYLEETIGNWSQSSLQNYTTGRRAVIAGLERIMFEPNLFDRGGRLLRSLAEYENEAGPDNATETFCRMFSLSYGYMANTKAPPSYRMSLLREMLCDHDAKKRSLGLKACRSALRIEYTSMSSLAHGDLDLDIKGWEPLSVAELQDSYLEVMKLLHEKMATFPADERRTSAQIIMDCSRNLLRELPGISTYVIERLSDIRDAVEQEAMLREILQIIEFDSDRLDPDAIARLERLRDDMAGSSYSDLLYRYVRMDPMVDPIGGKHEESRRTAIKDLAKQSLDGVILVPHLDWLVTNDAKCGNLFGYELSLLDRKELLLPRILEVQRRSEENGSGFFLGGYLAGVFEIDRERWNRTMHEIAEDDELLRFFVEISKSGMTDEIGMVLLDLVRTGRLHANQLSTLAFGLAERPSSGVMAKWINAMIDSGEPVTVVGALRPFYSFFARRQTGTIDVDLALRLLTHNALFAKEDPAPGGAAVNWIYWKEIAIRLIEQSPEKSMLLCKKILESVDGIETIMNRHHMMNVLDKIAAGSPDDVWDAASRYIDQPLDKRGRAISKWMRGGMLGLGASFLALVDHNKIFDWIDHDPRKRAPHMAHCVPPQLQGGNCLTRELLNRYGQDDGVQEALLANFLTRGASYSELQDYKKEKDRILKYKQSEDSVTVNQWLDAYVAVLDKWIERARIRE